MKLEWETRNEMQCNAMNRKRERNKKRRKKEEQKEMRHAHYHNDI